MQPPQAPIQNNHPPSDWLLQHAHNVHSQFGEDGIVQKALEVIGDRDGWCVEFGAWDGQHLSNTRRLIEEDGYCAVLIEPNPSKHADLEAFHANNPNVHTIQRFVGFTPDDNLDHILAPLNVPKGFDFLSIDIDGNDHHAWAAIQQHKPKIVCIEFNPTIPSDCDFVQPADPSLQQGAGIKPITELGKRLGYELICVTAANALFVTKEHFPKFNIQDNHPATLRKETQYITHLFMGYDGTIHLAGCRQMLWHNIELRTDEFQVLPKHLQSYRNEYTPKQEKQFLKFVDKRNKKLPQ